jgi:hypothetical protein
MPLSYNAKIDSKGRMMVELSMAGMGSLMKQVINGNSGYAMQQGQKKVFEGEELAKMKQEQIIALLKEFDAKSIAIDDKIVRLISIEGKEKLDQAMYVDYITNAEKVNEGIAEMAMNLMSIHTKVIEVSGSVRHYADDTNLPEGTLDASFDWERKTVRPPASETPSEEVKEGVMSFFKNIWNSIKSFFGAFKVASAEVDVALDNIEV